MEPTKQALQLLLRFYSNPALQEIARAGLEGNHKTLTEWEEVLRKVQEEETLPWGEVIRIKADEEELARID